jgi:DNA-binding beta-propeller fold protein YncE
MSTPEIGTKIYQYSHTIGIDDAAGRSFRCAVDLALGPEGRLYVLQRGVSLQKNLAVKICSVDEEFFGDFGSYGTGPGEWVWPAGIAADSQQQLYISDEWNQRITVFDKQGNLLDEWGEEGAEEGLLNRPSGLAFDAEDHLLVVDTYNHRIQKFTKDGKFLSTWGSHGSGPGEFNLPWGVAVNGAGEVYVTDWRNDRVQKFGPQGDFYLQWGSSGNGEGEFNRPVGIAVDQAGDVYVVDWHNHRVQIFDSSGRFQAQLTGDATLSTWAEQLLAANPVMMEQRRVAKDLSQEKGFLNPRGVKVDDQGRVFVVDSSRGRLQVYRKVTA